MRFAAIFAITLLSSGVLALPFDASQDFDLMEREVDYDLYERDFDDYSMFERLYAEEGVLEARAGTSGLSPVLQRDFDEDALEARFLGSSFQRKPKTKSPVDIAIKELIASAGDPMKECHKKTCSLNALKKYEAAFAEKRAKLQSLAKQYPEEGRRIEDVISGWNKALNGAKEYGIGEVAERRRKLGLKP